MRSPRRSFTPEFRILAIKLVNEGKSLVNAARELNISPQLLRSWVLNGDKDCKIFPRISRPAPLENELSLLKKENAQLRRENENIKRSSVYFFEGKSSSNLSQRHNFKASLCEDNKQASLDRLVLPSLNGLNMQIDQGAIQTRIAAHYMDLSKSHKKTANYVLSNMLRSATMSIDQLAIAAGISIATAHRFTRVLGFDSYPSFRAEVVSSLDAIFRCIDKRQAEHALLSANSQVIAHSLHEYMNTLELQMR
ncbi:MAG: transposase [Pseudomonadota bacterium]